MKNEVLIISALSDVNEDLKIFLSKLGYLVNVFEPIFDEDTLQEDCDIDYYSELFFREASFAIIDPLSMGKDWDKYWDSLKETGYSGIRIFRLDKHTVEEIKEQILDVY
jgi:hypothetical protein